MGKVTEELTRAAAGGGADMMTNVRLQRIDLTRSARTVEFEIEGKRDTVEARFVLLNFGPNILARLLGRSYHPESTHEGSVFKINMLLRRLPRLLAPLADASTAFCGTFHIDEGYEQMKLSYQQAAERRLPDRIPCEVYCHTLTDDSILSPELRARGYHAMTLFALDVPWRLFKSDNRTARETVKTKCLAGLNRWLAEPIEDCLALARNGEPCLEAKSPVDIEEELGHFQGNIFQGALAFPFAERPEEAGSWGVETEFSNVYFCGASARRGGGVSGIPGHNAAMKVLEALKGKKTGSRPQ
jgi:phytoene dehydrogenase-like protein